MPQLRWESIRDRKIEQQRSRIPKQWLIADSKLPSDDALNVMDIPRTCGILSPRELHITEDYDARALAAVLRDRRFTAVEVTTAFCKRATISDQLTHTLTEPLFASALARAEYLDAHLTRTSTPLGPLHGLPISVKDTFAVTGEDATIGISALAFQPSASTAPIVTLLLDAGAVVHCKTNVPQTMLAMDSVNNIFGRVLNPLNRKFWTAGGSSGGEAALVKMRGAVMGVGTDVGGSIRVPAMCNGLVGFKPGNGRISTKGLEQAQEDARPVMGLQTVVGPIVRSLDDISLFMEVVEKGRMWEVDPTVLYQEEWWTKPSPHKPLSIERKFRSGKLKFGIIYDDGNTSPLPPINKMLQSLTSRLRNRGIETVPIDSHTSGFSQCQSLANKFFSAQGNAHLLSLIASTDEPLIPWLAPRLKHKDPISIPAYRALLKHKQDVGSQMLLRCWKELGIDLILCPMTPHPVPPKDKWNAIGYTSSFVLLNYPVGVVPVGVVGEGDVEGVVGGEERGVWDKVNRALWADEEVRKGWVGSPLGVQVVGMKGREREAWEGMKVVEEVVGDEGRGKGREARL